MNFVNVFFDIIFKTVRYEFRITPSTGNFENVRAQCASMGGDLLSVSMKADGSQYHE